MTALPRPSKPWDRTPVERREYFDLLGPGLVAVVPARPPGGPGAGGWRPPTGGAWLHVGEDGRVRGFTGKAEVGQGTRSALTLVVAAELQTSPTTVELVMGDTDLCPWDIGTFGSRSMPDAAPALAAAARGAREALVRLAAGRTGAPPDRLEVSGGEVRDRGTGQSLPFGALVHGGRQVVVTGAGEPSAAPSPTWTPSARSAVDPHADEVVTGRRRFVSDVVRPGMLHGAVLWPPSYGARLAERPTVRKPEGLGATMVLEDGFVGAFARDAATARAAVQNLPVDWVVTPQPSEREVEAFLRSHPQKGDSWDSAETISGDVEPALAASRWMIEATYRSAYIAHVPLEPHCAVAEWTGPRLTVWVGSQTPFRLRGAVAQALGVPEDDVRVVVPPTGSGFGGKHGAEVALAASRLARAAGAPVRVAFSREEEFRHAYLRPMSIVDVRAGLGPDGRLLAWQFVNVNGGAAALGTPYRVPNQRVSNVLSESPLPQGSLRALGANANNFAREAAVDELVRQADLDPVEFRLRNLDDPRLVAVLRRVADLSGWSSRDRASGRGHGVAVGLEKGSRVATVAEVTVASDRRVRVERLVTAFDAGAVVNRDNLRSQVEGAVVMALGQALFEAIHFDRGTVVNPRLSQYRVPRFSDVPRLEVDLVDPGGVPPAGAGETPMIAVAPAVANAVFDACGVRLRALPLVPTGRVPLPSAG